MGGTLILRDQFLENSMKSRELVKDGISNGSAHNWLHKHRPSVAICPQKQDYFDTCEKHNADIHAR